MSNLYELTSELQALQSQLDAIEGDITPDLEDQLSELLHNLSDTHDAWMAKVDNTACLIKSREAWLDGIDTEIKRLQEMQRSERNQITWLKKNLMLSLVVRGAGKLNTARGRVSICRNGGKTPIAIKPDIDPANLPEKFQRVTVELDTNAVRDALEAGDPDATAIAAFKERGQYLRIK